MRKAGQMPGLSHFTDKGEELVAGDGFGLFLLGRGDADRLVREGEIGRCGFGDVAYSADLHYRRLRLLEDQLFVDGTDFGLFGQGLLAAYAVFFARGEGNVVLEVANAGGVVGVDDEGVFERIEADGFTLGVNLVFAVILVPFRHRRIFVHVFDDLAPAYAGVVCAEGNFTLLRGVRNDAHFGAAEVVVKKILEPHTGDKEEIPRILAALHGVFNTAIWGSAAVLGGGLLRQGPGLVEFLEKVVEFQTFGAFEGLVILQEGHGHHEVREILAASRVGNVRDVFGELHGVQEARNRRPFLGFFVDHQSRADAAIR